MSQVLRPRSNSNKDDLLGPPFSSTHQSCLLVVDNDSETLESLQDFLQSLLPGVDVVCVPSVCQGLRILATRVVDVVLCEFRLTGMNGVQFLKECRRLQPAAVRMLYMSSPSLDVAIPAVNEARVDHVFRKPLQPDALAQALTRALDVSRFATVRPFALGRIRDGQAGQGPQAATTALVGATR
jgi:DNA-binding NtrC family response regulator